MSHKIYLDHKPNCLVGLYHWEESNPNLTIQCDLSLSLYLSLSWSLSSQEKVEHSHWEVVQWVSDHPPPPASRHSPMGGDLRPQLWRKPKAQHSTCLSAIGLLMLLPTRWSIQKSKLKYRNHLVGQLTTDMTMWELTPSFSMRWDPNSWIQVTTQQKWSDPPPQVWKLLQKRSSDKFYLIGGSVKIERKTYQMKRFDFRRTPHTFKVKLFFYLVGKFLLWEW